MRSWRVVLDKQSTRSTSPTMSTFRSPGFRCLLVTLVTMANAETSAAVAQQGCLPPSATARVGLMRLIHPGGVAALHFSANGKRLISVGEDDVVRTWDLVSGTEAHSWDAGHFRAVGFAPDGSSLATISGTETLTHWTSNGRRRAIFKVGPKQSLGSLSLNLDGDRLVVRQPGWADQYLGPWHRQAFASVRPESGAAGKDRAVGRRQPGGHGGEGARAVPVGRRRGQESAGIAGAWQRC